MENSEDFYRQIGKMEADIETLHEDVAEIKADVKKMSEQVYRWKGAGAILLLVGAGFGWLVDLAHKLLAKGGM